MTFDTFVDFLFKHNVLFEDNVATEVEILDTCNVWNANMTYYVVDGQLKFCGFRFMFSFVSMNFSSYIVGENLDQSRELSTAF